MATPTVTVSVGSRTNKSFNPADFNSILQAAAALSRETDEVVDVTSSGGSMYRYGAEKVTFPYTGGVRWTAKGTKLYTQSTAGLVLTLPDMVGYPTTKNVESNILGTYIVVEEGDGASTVTFDGLIDMGLTSTPTSTSRRWVGTQVMANKIALSRCSWINKTSLTTSLANSFPYKTLNDRGITEYTAFALGIPRKEEANPALCRSINDVNLTDLSITGEALKQQLKTTAAFSGIHIRKTNNIKIDGVKFSTFVSPEDRLIYDLVFSAIPSVDDTLVINDWNPFTRKFTQLTYTFKASAASAFQVTIGATAAATSQNLVNAINANNVRAGGSYFAQAISSGAASYIGDSSVASCRIQQGNVTTSSLSTVGFVPYYDDGNNASNAVTYVTIGTGSYGLVREVNDGQRQNHYMVRGIWMEDCGAKQVQNIFPGCSISQSPILTTSTMEYLNLTPAEFSEGGHDNYDAIIGDGCSYTEAMLDIRGSGFSVIGDRVNPGQCGSLNHSARPAPLVRYRPGTHREWLLDLTSSNATTADALYIEDGNGNTATFTFKTTPDTVKIAFASAPTDGDTLNISYLGTPYLIRFQKGGGAGGTRTGVVDTAVATTAALCASHVKAIINALTGDSTLFAYTASNTYTNSGELAVTASSSSSAITVTTAPKEIKIGADTATTLQSFRRAVQYQCDTRGLNAYVGTYDAQGGGAYRVTIYFFTETGAYSTWPRCIFTTGGTNFTLTKHHQPYRPSFVTSKMRPHWIWDGMGGCNPMLQVEDSYTPVRISGQLTNAYPMSLGSVAGEVFKLVATGNNPANGDKITIKPSAAGTAQVFEFVNTITSDTVPTSYQVKRDGSSYEVSLMNLLDKINTISAAGCHAYRVEDTLYIVKGYRELDSSFVALTVNAGNAFSAASRLLSSCHIKLTGIPADNAYVQVVMTTGGTTYKFQFKAGGGTDNTPSGTYWIDTTTYNTVEAAAERLKNQMNTALGTYIGLPVAEWIKGGIVYYHNAYTDLAVTESGDSGSDIAIAYRYPDWLQSRHNPVVLIGCKEAEIVGVSSSLLAIHNYNDTTGVFAENYFGVGVMDNGLNALPEQFLAVEQRFYRTITLGSAPSNSEVWIVTQEGEVGKFILVAGGGTNGQNKWYINTTTFNSATLAGAELARLINYAMGGLYASNASGVVTVHNLLGGDSITDPTDTGNVVTLGTLTVWDSAWSVLVTGATLQGKTAGQRGDTHTPTMTVPWGPGRTGNAKFYDVGPGVTMSGTAPNLTVSNIVLPSGSNYVNKATI